MKILIVGFSLIFFGYLCFACNVAADGKGITIEKLGQFGDSFGVLTSLFTFLALGGLVWQILQERKHHKENITEQKRLREEDLKLQKEHFREEIEVQRMGVVNAEHPLIQTNSCSMWLYKVDVRPTKFCYGVVWQFTQGNESYLRNPIFCCTLTDDSNKTLGMGYCRPGQLPLSLGGWYEAFFTLDLTDEIKANSECTMKVLFQNSLGGYFKYSESCRLISIDTYENPIHEVVFDTVRSELVNQNHSAIKSFSEKNYFGLAFVRTPKPIIDIPMTETDFKDEIHRIESLPASNENNFCQAVIDPPKYAANLCDYLKNH